MSGGLDTKATHPATRGESSASAHGGIASGDGAAVSGDGAALTAATLCEAFQQTAALHADRVALRTIGDAVSITWAQYAQRVQRLAQGLAALGVRHGDTVGHHARQPARVQLIDTAALHLGAAPFSIYNTCSAEQVAYLFANANNRVVVTEPEFLPTIRAAGVDSLEHVICLDDAPEGTLTFADVESLATAGFDFEASWPAVGSRGPRHDLLHVGYDRAAQGRRAHPRQRAGRVPCRGGSDRASARRSHHLLPAPRAHGRPLLDALRRRCCSARR